MQIWQNSDFSLLLSWKYPACWREGEAILISTEIIWRARLAAKSNQWAPQVRDLLFYRWLVILYLLWAAWSMQLCKMLLQESSGTKHQSSAIGKNQLDTRERTMKKMWQLFHYLFSPTCVSWVYPTRYRRLKNCDKSLGITLPSFNFLRRQIIKHLHKSLSAIFVSEVQTNCNFLGQCYSAKFTAVRRARRVRLTFFESLIAQSNCQTFSKTTLSSVDDHFQALAGLQLGLPSSVDDLLVLFGPAAEHLDELVNGSGGDERAHDPPPLLWSLGSFTVLQSHPHNLQVS